MPTYVRAAGEHVAERVRPEPGSDDETRYEQLAADPMSGWRRLDDVEGAADHGAAPTTPAQETEPGKRPPQSAPKADWVAWATSHGMDADQADDLTKAELIKLADELEEE
ncbi:hypothetical protein [Nonomuraea angiospora]